ncbi:MAG: RNA methyltransferase [Acidimicrobiales bacterium]
MTARQHCLAVCAPGLEDLCAAELGDLGIRIRRAFRGGVEFSASERELYSANVWLRTATRVVVRVAQFEASGFAELEHHVRDVAWDRWVPAGCQPQVRASSTSSRLYHTGAIEERLAELAGSGNGAGPLLVARLIHDRVTLSIDSSGEPLYRRGWRQETAKAPLRETLAAAMLLASDWDRAAPLVDPLCGSGTIAIEAALLAARLPPGAGRTFAFQDWPSFQPGTWSSVWADAAAATNEVGAVGPIVASDRDAGAVRATAANAARAGVADLIDVRRTPLSEIGAAGAAGWVVTNPPYGKRVGGDDLRDLYATLGRVVRDRGDWRVGMLVADSGLARHTGLRLEERLRTDNGGIPVRYMVDLP